MSEVFKEKIYVTRPLLPKKEDFYHKIEEIWDSKWLTNNGSQQNQLEQELKKYLKVENITLFCNGTLALLLGIKALRLTGEVITTPFTFPATVEALDWNGLMPVFCDIDPITLNIDAEKIEALITPRTSAILAVHVFGNPCDVYKIEAIARKYNLRVIYDGAHVFGTKLDGLPIGTFGDMTMFSFHATKLFNTIEGGALAFNNGALKERLNLLKNFGIKNPEEVVLSGLNAKMNEVQAAMGLEVLKLIDEERQKRKAIKKIYEEKFENVEGIRVITTLDNEKSSYQYFVIEIDEEKFGKSRDFVYEELKRHNVFARKYFYPLCSNFEWYNSNESAKKEKLPVANGKIKQVLALPFYGDICFSNIRFIGELIRNISGVIQL